MGLFSSSSKRTNITNEYDIESHSTSATSNVSASVGQGHIISGLAAEKGGINVNVLDAGAVQGSLELAGRSNELTAAGFNSFAQSAGEIFTKSLSFSEGSQNRAFAAGQSALRLGHDTVTAAFDKALSFADRRAETYAQQAGSVLGLAERAANPAGAAAESSAQLARWAVIAVVVLGGVSLFMVSRR